MSLMQAHRTCTKGSRNKTQGGMRSKNKFESSSNPEMPVFDGIDYGIDPAIEEHIGQDRPVNDRCTSEGNI